MNMKLCSSRRSRFATGSPISRAILWRQYWQARRYSLAEVFAEELTLSVNCVLKGDFVEGVRALLIDKDKDPRWQQLPPEEWLDEFYRWPQGAQSVGLQGITGWQPADTAISNARSKRDDKDKFIGLGNMGGPMAAANLARAGYTVQVFDLVADNIDRAIAAGCIAAGDAREALTGCEAVISMLPAGEHVRALWLGESAGERGGQDLLAALPVGALVIDCSTIDVDSARQGRGGRPCAWFALYRCPRIGWCRGAAAGTLHLYRRRRRGGF